VLQVENTEDLADDTMTTQQFEEMLDKVADTCIQ